jgi:hypothetical protein
MSGGSLSEDTMQTSTASSAELGPELAGDAMQLSNTGTVASTGTTESVEVSPVPNASGGAADGVASLHQVLLECPICLQLLCEPLTTPCGHSFCRPCLVSTLRKNKKKCPSCRAVCHMEPETQSESIVLASIVKTCFPSQYAMRLKEVEEEKESWATVLPIFYYNDTLFPSSVLSLHLFEERYKVMIRRIVENSRKFCYLPNFSNYQVLLVVQTLDGMVSLMPVSAGSCR